MLYWQKFLNHRIFQTDSQIECEHFNFYFASEYSLYSTMYAGIWVILMLEKSNSEMCMMLLGCLMKWAYRDVYKNHLLS